MSEENVVYTVNNGLDVLATQLANIKAEEAKIKDKRIEIEEKIGRLVETKANGSKTVNVGNGLKIVVKRAMKYKADVKKLLTLEGIDDELKPLMLTPAIPAHYEFDAKAYEQMIEYQPALAAKLKEVVDVKPAKISVTLKM